jgi:hypothetical protein
MVRRSAVPKGLSLVVVGLGTLASGCWQDIQTIWSVEVRSPDGVWIAIGRADEHGGPGTASIETGLYLQPATRSSNAQPVLLFLNDLSLYKGGISLSND